MLLWDVTDPTRPRRLGDPLTGHTDAVYAVAFAPDGRTLATASVDQTVLLWDVTDPTRPRRLGDPLTGHTGAVYAVAFAPDGHTLATASADQTVLLWDVTDPTRPRRLGDPLTGHTGAVYAVAFAPDGHTLATASGDQTVLLWDVTDPTRPRRLGDPLTGHTGRGVRGGVRPGRAHPGHRQPRQDGAAVGRHRASEDPIEPHRAGMRSDRSRPERRRVGHCRRGRAIPRRRSCEMPVRATRNCR